MTLFLSNVTAIVIWLSLAHFDNSDDLSLPLPNPLNISFHPSIILRVGLFVVPFCKYITVLRMRNVASGKPRPPS